MTVEIIISIPYLESFTLILIPHHNAKMLGTHIPTYMPDNLSTKNHKLTLATKLRNAAIQKGVSIFSIVGRFFTPSLDTSNEESMCSAEYVLSICTKFAQV